MIYTSSLELCDGLPSEVKPHEHQAGWYYSVWAWNTFWQAFVTVGGGRLAITHKAPRQDSCLVNGGYDYARHSLRRWKQFLSWFTGLIGPDPWVCWPLTNQGKLQRWNSLFCEPSPNSLTPTQSLRDYVQSKAWRSRGFVSAQQCQSWTRVFWKHLGSKISLKLTQELKIIFNPIRDRSKFVFFILLWAARN